MELVDNYAEATVLGLNYEQKPHNARIGDLMRSVFPTADHSRGKLFITIESTNPVKLCESIDTFISTFKLIAEETFDLDDYKFDIIKHTRVEVGHRGSTCVILIPLSSTDVTENYNDMIDHTFESIDDTGIRANCSVGLGMSLKDLLKHVVMY